MPSRHRYVLALLLALACLACREALAPAPTPTPVERAGELYTCSNGLERCRVTYTIGPVTRVAGGVVRVDFVVALDGPRGGTTSWTNDTAMHAYLRSEGQRGIALVLQSDQSVHYELTGVGGIAAVDETLVAPVKHEGYWEFSLDEPAGTQLLLLYPDFIDRPVPIVLPD